MTILENLIPGVRLCIITNTGEMVTGEFKKWFKEFGSIIITLPRESCYLQIDVLAIDFILEIV